MNQRENGSLATPGAQQQLAPATSLRVGEGSIDLAGLTAEQVQAIKIKHAERAIERDDRTIKIAADVHSLDHSLRTMAENTLAVAAEGGNVTVTNTRDDHLGRTEIIMGTSEAARAGKLTRSQMGGQVPASAWLVLALAAIAAVVIIAALVR